MASAPTGTDAQAVLLAELQHRVRTTLATTRMIARRSAELSESLEEYAAHLDGRLAALARVQNVILQNVRAGVDLGRLVTDELASARAYGDAGAQVSGPDVRLHLRAAEPLALALHELTTNALKFGALSSSTGRLAVTWEIAAREGRPHLVFDWVESGLNLDPQAPRRRGFGTVVLLEMITYNLGAEVDLTIATGGLRYQMVLPLTERILYAA